MATIQFLEEFKEAANKFKELDREKLLRTDLGVESLEQEIGPLLDSIQNKIFFAEKYIAKLHDNYINQFVGPLNQICDLLTEQTVRNNQEYIANKNTVLSNFNSYIENLLIPWPFFVVAAIESKGVLENLTTEDIYQEAIDKLEKKINLAEQEVKDTTGQAIKEAKRLADDIEKSARRTATGISVEEVQKQFREAQKPLY